VGAAFFFSRRRPALHFQRVPILQCPPKKQLPHTTPRTRRIVRLCKQCLLAAASSARPPELGRRLPPARQPRMSAAAAQPLRTPARIPTPPSRGPQQQRPQRAGGRAPACALRLDDSAASREATPPTAPPSRLLLDTKRPPTTLADASSPHPTGRQSVPGGPWPERTRACAHVCMRRTRVACEADASTRASAGVRYPHSQPGTSAPSAHWEL